MKNWNSKIKEYTDIVGEHTIKRAERAVALKEMGLPVKDIARQLNLSKSRIYEYLRE